MTSAITAANSAAASALATGSAAALGSSEGTEDRFLALLVAQMRNQDPLNPLDNSEVTSQMAQINTVSGIERLNATLKSLASGFADGQALQAAALIGRDVLVEGSGIALGTGGAVAGFELGEAADKVVVEIRDASGRVVHRADLGAQKAGVHSFQWDGANDAGAALAAGSYSFSLSATRGSAPVDATALSAQRVFAVSRGADGTQLDLGAAGLRPYGAVKQIL